MKRSTILAILALAFLPSAAGAQIEPPRVDDCAFLCTSDSFCTTSCYSGGSYITCGDYGVCDVDPDGDNLPYWLDNCPSTYNPGQEDCDGDGLGDVCDSRDGVFTLAEARNCWIRNRLHLWGSDTTLYTEGRFEDTSACGSPDYWQKLDEWKVSCVGQFDSFACCTSTWGFQACWDLNFNTCHY